jgi:hypothetical protein
MIFIMKIDRKTLAARLWAVPAISGLLVLHHDFKTPRLANVNRLVWSESSVEVSLQYGICNLSGNVIDSTDIVVILHQDGAVGIRTPLAVADNPNRSLLTFLAGEVYRESLRWAEQLRSWEEGEAIEFDRAAIFAIVSSLVAQPTLEMNVEVEKNVQNSSGIRKVRLIRPSQIVEIAAAGLYGVNIHVKGTGNNARVLRLFQETDLRQPSAQAATHRERIIKRASFGARQLMRLPIGALQYWSRKKQCSDISPGGGFVDYLPASVVDAHAGDSLSALSN